MRDCDQLSVSGVFCAKKKPTIGHVPLELSHPVFGRLRRGVALDCCARALGFRDHETHENNETDEKEQFAENSSGEMRLVVFGESLNHNISSLTT
jgi:hypothetical protein